jgi:hypothetical protein
MYLVGQQVAGRQRLVEPWNGIGITVLIEEVDADIEECVSAGAPSPPPSAALSE